MYKPAAACVGLLVMMLAVTAMAQREKGSTLSAAISEFNEETRAKRIATSQLPLTEEELVASIRGWIPEQTPGVTDAIYEQFQQIAETRELPENAKISLCPSWVGYRGFRFDVWWIDLTIMNDDGTGWTFRIRDNKISSRKMTDAELDEMKRQHDSIVPN